MGQLLRSLLRTVKAQGFISFGQLVQGCANPAHLLAFSSRIQPLILATGTFNGHSLPPFLLQTGKYEAFPFQKAVVPLSRMSSR